MHALLSLILCIAVATASAQPFAIGQTSRNFYDPDRSREIPCEIRYPAAAEGDDTPFVDGAFPVVVIGHGFVMTVDAYAYLWEYFVPRGYIVVLPTTEGGFAPDHAAFGADLAFVAEQMTTENNDASSFFFGHVSDGRALAGHSMGGGAALLGAAGNTLIQAVMALAPAETSPSAIAAAELITVPTLIFGADEDCVTPIATNQQPMYDAVDVPCKALLTVLGGGHCYFGDQNFLCSFGEATCAPDLTITREQQHAIVHDLGGLWLDGWLKDSTLALAAFQDSMASSSRFTSQSTCLSTAANVIAPFTGRLIAYPVPVVDHLMVQLPHNGTGMIRVSGTDGRPVMERTNPGERNLSLDLGSLASGLYRVCWYSTHGAHCIQVIKH